MMTAQDCHVIGGVDTHAEVHVAAALDRATGQRLGIESFPADTAGYVALLAWLRSFGNLDVVGVESTGAWGAGLARSLTAGGVRVVEVDRPDRKARRLEGKSDPIDAQAAARAVLSGRATGTPKASNGPAEAVRALEIVCNGAVRDRTRATNQFKALLVTAPAGLRERMTATTFRRQLELARRFHDHDDPIEAQLRFSLKALARKIAFLNEQIAELEARMNTLTAQAAPSARRGLRGRAPRRRQALGHHRRQPRPDPQRSRVRQALRRVSDPRLLRQDHPPPTQPRRRPASQQRPLHDRASPHALPRTHPGLRRPTHHRRQDPHRDHPLPQTLRRPRDLQHHHQPARHPNRPRDPPTTTPTPTSPSPPSPSPSTWHRSNSPDSNAASTTTTTSPAEHTTGSPNTPLDVYRSFRNRTHRRCPIVTT